MSKYFFRIFKLCMARVILLVSFFLILTCRTVTAQKQMQRPVDVVVCMDLSGSTNGLVEVFRDKMWDIINQWKMFTPTPSLRIGVIGFSRFSFTGNSGYVKVITPLTDDYDQLSSDLFDIKPHVENGIQFIGAALGTSLHDMEWSEKANTLKLVYIIGNGEVNLGNYNYLKLCEEAKEKGVIVNTVYCLKSISQLRDKELPGWKEIANITGGECYEINLSKRLPLLAMDANVKLLAVLNDSLNGTFIPYGKKGIDHLKLMLKSDENSVRIYDGYLYSRLKYKLSPYYSAKQLSWDVVTYKQTYPDSKLAAIRPSTTSPQNVGLDLEKVVNAELEKRLQLLESLRLTMPMGEEERIHSAAGSSDFEIGNMLDRVMIATFYKQAVESGFKN